MKSTKQSLSQKLFLALHVGIVMLVIASPLFLSRKKQSKYGFVIFCFLYAIILGWIVIGQCPLNGIQNSEKYGSVTTFLYSLGFNAIPYSNTIGFVSTYLTFATIFYYSPSIKFTIATILLLLCYNLDIYINNKPNIKEVIEELA